jgi:hypothetical protein
VKTLEELDEIYLQNISKGGGDFIFTRHSVAFKCHECEKCQTVIGLGEKFYRIVGTENHYFYMRKFHESCLL